VAGAALKNRDRSPQIWQWKRFKEWQIGSHMTGMGVIGPPARARQREPRILDMARLPRCGMITPSHSNPKPPLALCNSLLSWHL
jgi:hypothetical protein